MTIQFIHQAASEYTGEKSAFWKRE